MEEKQYQDLRLKEGASELARPFWKGDDFHKNIWEHNDITVLICQRKTKDITQLCLESLLRFYPDVSILVVDGNSQDDSTLYLRYMAAKYSNVKVWERTGLNSHGDTMNEAITDHITTEYVLLMDSDVITMRHGMIEGMVQQLQRWENMYATGNTMLVTRKNQACGYPEDESDVLRYAHPCLSVYHIPTYKTLHRFYDHGAACCENMIEAERKGLQIGVFPVDKYTVHLSGASWQEISAVWNTDNGVRTRPFITFITTSGSQVDSLQAQTDRDFDIVPIGPEVDRMVSLHGRPDPHVRVNNRFYDIRFRMTGEYICFLPEALNGLRNDFVHQAKIKAIHAQAADVVKLRGLELIERKHWQETKSLSL